MAISRLSYDQGSTTENDVTQNPDRNDGHVKQVSREARDTWSTCHVKHVTREARDTWSTWHVNTRLFMWRMVCGLS